MKSVCLIIFVFVALSIAEGLGAREHTQDYLAGYVKGVLEVKFGIHTASV